MKTMDALFESLMTTPCTIFNKTKTVNDLGDAVYTLSDGVASKCNFHNLNINNSQFADKIGNRTGFLICVSKKTEINVNSIVEINSQRYIIVGIRQASVQFEQICEAVLYE